MSICKEFSILDGPQKRYLIYMFFFWTIDYWNTLLRRLGIEKAELTNMILLLIVALSCKSIWSYYVRRKDSLRYVFLALVYFLSGIIYPESSGYIAENANRFLICTLPFYFVGLTFTFEENRKWVIRFAYFITILNVAYMFLFTSNPFDADKQEAMRKAYILLPSLLVILWNFIESRKVIDMFFAVLCFVMISGYGTRGPFVCMIFFLLVYLFFYKEWKRPKIARGLVVICSFALYVYAEYFAMLMINIVTRIGLSTRIFDSILNNSFINFEKSHGRDIIQEALFIRLDANNGQGFGLYTDRIVGNGSYAHNFFVEVWYQFGYIIGSAIALAYLLLVVFTLNNSKNRTSSIFIVAIFCASFLQLMFSGSYLQNTGFYFLMGLCAQNVRKSQFNYHISNLEI